MRLLFHTCWDGYYQNKQTKINKTQEITYIGKDVVGKQIGVTIIDKSMNFS